jgi:hypothetical protein
MKSKDYESTDEFIPSEKTDARANAQRPTHCLFGFAVPSVGGCKVPLFPTRGRHTSSSYPLYFSLLGQVGFLERYIWPIRFTRQSGLKERRLVLGSRVEAESF